MPKTYFNDAIIGNSSMLGCITSKGELVRLYWPHIDWPQHIEKLAAGVFIPEIMQETLWLEADDWIVQQRYLPDTNILETDFTHNSIHIKIKQTDFVMTEEDVLFRNYEFRNMSDEIIKPKFIIYTSAISTNENLSGVMFDEMLDTLVHYRHNYYVSISSDIEVSKFQLGNDAFKSAKMFQIKGYDNIGMMNDAALGYEIGELLPGEVKKFCIYLCAAHSLKEVKNEVKNRRSFRHAQPGVSGTYSIYYCGMAEQLNTEKYWKNFLSSTKKINIKNEEMNELYKRSILVFKLMSDKKTGGLLASPEIDEGFTKCGRYAYCWGRDAAFITGALDVCGLYEDVERFYRWAAHVQDDQGSWQQRYHLDGNLAPSWGLQIDETGTILWGILQHFKITGDMKFLGDMWECMRKGAEFLTTFIDIDTGLPFLSFDLWEERLGEHAYSSAAVYGGIMAASEAADILGLSDCYIEKWKSFAGELRKAIEVNFWKQDWHRFIRSVRVKLNPWGEEYTADKVNIKVNSKGDVRDFTAEDWTVDISLLGLTVPFGVYEAGHDKMKGTISVIEQVLGSSYSDGLMRYERDNYAGGNPWIIASLWAALYHIENADFNKALDYFFWAAGGKNSLGLLPEQVYNVTGKPAWVIPLTWSHAMFVLVLDKLAKSGKL